MPEPITQKIRLSLREYTEEGGKPQGRRAGGWCWYREMYANFLA